MPGEKETMELKGAVEFSTCLNATGRNRRYDVGLQIARGMRGAHYNELMSLLRLHRKNIAQALSFVEESGVGAGPKGYVQYFDAYDNIKPSIIGTVAGMILGTGNTDPYRPMIGFAAADGGVKVSGRCSRLLALQGINMAKSMSFAAGGVGGIGGGHTVACGAFIPPGKTEEFIKLFEEHLVGQNGKRG
jgi:RecJ-like exonuclease